MKAIKDTLRASKLAMMLPNNYSPHSQTAENTSSVTTLCGPPHSPQLHGGGTFFQSPPSVGGTESSTYPLPPHSTVFQPHVAPGGSNISYPHSPSSMATSVPSFVPSASAMAVLGGTHILYPQSPPMAAGPGVTVMSSPSAGALGDTGPLYPQSPPNAGSTTMPFQLFDDAFTGNTVLSPQLPPDTRDLAFSDSSLFTSPTSPATIDMQLTIDTSQTLFHQPSAAAWSPAPSISAVDYHPHIPLSPTTPLSASPRQPPPKPLTKEHMADICKCLFPLRAKWKTIGTFLCVEHNTLAAIKADSEDSAEMLTELIAEWLKSREPPPTGQALADAVQYISPDKAEEIRQIF